MPFTELHRENPEIERESPSQPFEEFNETFNRFAKIDPIGADDLKKHIGQLLNERYELSGKADYRKFRDTIANCQDYIKNTAQRTIHGPDAHHLAQDLIQNVNEKLIEYGQRHPDELKDLIDPQQPFKMEKFLELTIKNMAKDMFKMIRRNPLYNRDEIYEEGINGPAITGETAHEKLPQFVDLDQEDKMIDTLDSRSAASRNDTATTEKLLQLENHDLIQGLAKLKDPDREVLLLRLDGLNNTEIANKIGATVGSVEKRIERAKEKLKEKITF